MEIFQIGFRKKFNIPRDEFFKNITSAHTAPTEKKCFLKNEDCVKKFESKKNFFISFFVMKSNNNSDKNRKQKKSFKKLLKTSSSSTATPNCSLFLVHEYLTSKPHAFCSYHITKWLSDGN